MLFKYFIRMRDQVFLLCVLVLLRSALGNIPTKSCDDCTSFGSCEAVSVLIQRNKAAAYDQLREIVCGFDNNKLPMVCCSMVPTGEPGVDSIKDHPNLRLLPETCGVIVPTKVLGGLAAQLYEYPWMALIAYRTKLGMQFQCSGSLINERYVLTPAHCLWAPANPIAGVRIGEFNIDTESDCQGVPPYETCESHIQDLRVEEAIPHPGYQRKPNIKNDIGLIRLKKPVDLTFKNARPICLPVTKDLQERNVSGLYGTIAGWGLLGSEHMTSSRLLTIGALIHSQNNCSDAFNTHPRDIDFTDKLCASGYGISASTVGDGPLMVSGSHNGESRYIQYGVFSFGGHNQGSTAVTVYTDVSKHMKWILDNIKP